MSLSSGFKLSCLMKNVTKIFAFTAIMAFMMSCAKDTELATNDNITYITASSPSTKVYLGNDGVSSLWSDGDKIKVNNHNSIGLEAGKNYGETAEFGFTAQEQPAAPYYAVYNALRAYDFDADEHTYRVSLDYNDYTQTWVEDSFDPHFALLYGFSESASGIAFHHAMSFLKITPTLGEENVNIAKIMVFSNADETISGRFYINVVDGTLTDYRSNKPYVTMAGPEDGVELGKSFMIAVPAKEYASGLTVRFIDVNGNMMEKVSKPLTTVAGTVYPISAVYTHTSSCPPVASAAETSSSTACFTWTMGGTAEEDIAKSYTVQCSADEDFSETVERTIPASSTIWKKKTPKFVFGGLDQNTTYYFRVKLNEDGAVWSNVVSATTGIYDKTVVSSDVKAGDVILAEDFAALSEGGEGVFGAAGYGTVDGAFKSSTDAKTVNTETLFNNFPSLADWGFCRLTTNANFYVQQGHIKLGTGSDQSYLVTPQLSAIPEGKLATVKISVTAASYVDDADNVKRALVAAQDGDINANHLFTITGGALTNKAEFDLASNNTAWNTYDVTLNNVRNTNRIIIGVPEDKGGYRLNVSDVRVEVVAIENLKVTDIQLVQADRTNATIKWNNISTEFGYGSTYLISVFKDEACTDPVYNEVITYDAPLSRYSPYGTSKFLGQKSGNAITPSDLRVCCGLLEPATDYWFKVKPLDGEITVKGKIDCKTDDDKISTFYNTAAGAPWSDAFHFTTAAAHTAVANEVIYCGFDAINIGPNFETVSAGVSPRLSGPKATDAEKAGFPDKFAAGTYTDGWFTWTLDRRNQSGGYTVAKWGFCVDDSDALYLDGTNKKFTLNGETTRYNRKGKAGDVKDWYFTSQCYPGNGHVFLNGVGNFVGTPALETEILGDAASSCTVTVKAAKVANNGNTNNVTIKVYKYSKVDNTLDTSNAVATLTIDGKSCYKSWTATNNYTSDYTPVICTCDVELAKGDALVFATSADAIIDEIQIVKK